MTALGLCSQPLRPGVRGASLERGTVEQATLLVPVVAAAVLLVGGCTGEASDTSTAGVTEGVLRSQGAASPTPRPNAAQPEVKLPKGYRWVKQKGYRLALPKTWQQYDVDPDNDDGDLDLPVSTKEKYKDQRKRGLAPDYYVDPRGKTRYLTFLSVLQQPIAPRLDDRAAENYEGQVRADGLRNVRAELAEVRGDQTLRTTADLPLKSGALLHVEEFIFVRNGSSTSLSLTSERPRHYRDTFNVIVRHLELR